MLGLLPLQEMCLLFLVRSSLVCLLIAILVDNWCHNSLCLSLRRVLDARLRRAVFPFSKLTLVSRHILALKLSHLLDLVEVNNEALLVGVLELDALTTEDGPVV